MGELDDGVVASQADRLMDVAEAELLGLLAFQLAHDRGRRMQRGRNAALAGAVHDAVALPDRGRVADGVDVRVRHRPQRFVGDDAAAVVDFETGSSRHRGYPHTGRPQHGLRIDDLAVGEGDTVGHHLDDLDAGMHPHTEPIQARVQPGPRAWRPSSIRAPDG